MNTPINNRQATLAVLRRAKTEVAAKQRRLQAFQDAGEPPPEHLVEELRTDEDYLSYLDTLVQ